MDTRFAVAVPTHDRRETTLLAVRSALAQTRPPDVVLVLCDGCSDGTAEAVRALADPRVRVLDLPKGPGYAYAHRNLALDLPDVDVVLWLADDDLLLPDHLERIGERWDAGDVDMVVGPAVLVHEDDALQWLARDYGVPGHREAVARTNHCPMACVSVRVAAAREAGGWDGSLARTADWDLWRRLLDRGALCAMTHEPTVLHFRATTRAQAWPDRVRQNAAWLARLQDPEALAALRRALRRARDVRDGEEYEEAHRTRDALQDARAELQRGADLYGATYAELTAAHARELEAAHRIDFLERGLATALRDRDAARATLTAIYAGGWWQLRDRMHRVRARLPGG
ncbi:MAG: glycosyl transferase family protein [Solirubrobacterales bacterium]|nr:glycosyl transferase family protein [Solirubrobacterales bacterium]